MNRKSKNSAAKKAALGAGLTVGGLALAAGALYTEIMTTVIARRRSPMTDKLTEIATGTPTPTDPVHDEWAQKLKDTPTDPIEIRARDGMVLRAHRYRAEHPRRVLILAHGWHSTWNRDFCASSPFFHDNDCELLLIEQRCHGESGGGLISYGINERYDVLSWLEWVEANIPGLPVYLCGISMGAATVLMTAGLPIAGRVSGIIADCGYTTPKEIISETVGKVIGKATAPTVAAVNLNCRVREGFGFSDYSTIDAMTQNKDVPILFIHGDADDFVPWRMSLENYLACQAPKELWIVPGAGHGLAYVVDTPTYQKKVLDFFTAHDTRCTPASEAV